MHAGQQSLELIKRQIQPGNIDVIGSQPAGFNGAIHEG
jgi:hypothetical protein